MRGRRIELSQNYHQDKTVFKKYIGPVVICSALEDFILYVELF